MTATAPVNSTSLPAIAAAPTRGNVTIIQYQDSGTSTFVSPAGRQPGDFEFSALKPNNESTPSRAVLVFERDGVTFRIESTGSFAIPKKEYQTVGDYLRDYPQTSTTSTHFFKNGVLYFEEFYSTPKLSIDINDQQYSLSKLETLYSGNDVFIGSADSSGVGDKMNGYAGDDTFYGNSDSQGSDLIHGGAGTDTAVYRGKRSDYLITQSSKLWDPVRKIGDLSGFLITDTVANRDGDDELYQIERLQFSDYVVSLPDLKIIGSVGPTSGAQSTGGSGASATPTPSTPAGSGSTTGGSATGTTGTTPGATTPTSPTAPTTPVATTPVAPIIPNGTERNGTESNDRLQGGAGPDVIRSGGGNDIIIGSDGSDFIDGGAGLDQLTYTSRTSVVSFALDTGGNIQVRGASKTDTLTGVERLIFSDKAYAMDLGGSAGTAAKTIVAAIGKTKVSEYLGIALSLTDKGLSVEDLAKIVINNQMLPSDHSQLVKTIFKNVTNREPNILELSQFKGMLDRGEVTPSQLLSIAANTTLVEAVITEIALAGIAIEYQPTLA